MIRPLLISLMLLVGAPRMTVAASFDCESPSDPIEVEICTNGGLLGLLHDLMSEVYQDALTDITWLTESDVAEVRLEAREALNQCGETTSCLQEVYFDTIDLLSINSVRFDARAQYQGFFYIPLDDEAKCSDGYVLDDDGRCFEQYGAGPHITAITHKNSIAVEMSFVSGGNAHMCSFRGSGIWSGEYWTVPDSSFPECELKISLTGAGISVVQNNECNVLCGMRATDGLNQIFGTTR
jgi:uncharacterized protein